MTHGVCCCVVATADAPKETAASSEKNSVRPGDATILIGMGDPQQQIPLTVSPLFAAWLRFDPWLTREEAAQYARCSVSLIDRAATAEGLRSGRTDGRRVFKRSAIDEWLERKAD